MHCELFKAQFGSFLGLCKLFDAQFGSFLGLCKLFDVHCELFKAQFGSFLGLCQFKCLIRQDRNHTFQSAEIGFCDRVRELPPEFIQNFHHGELNFHGKIFDQFVV